MAGQLIRKFKKENSPDALRHVLERLYRIAILGEAANAIMLTTGPEQWREYGIYLKKSLPEIKQMTYASHGVLTPPIPGASILSSADYKNLVAVFGSTDKEFDPSTLMDAEFQKRNSMMKAREADYYKAAEAKSNPNQVTTS